MIIYIQDTSIIIANIEHSNEDAYSLIALRKGEVITLDSIFKKYYPIPYAYGSKFVDNEESEEIAGDVILRLWGHRQTLQVETSLGRYLLKSIYHRSLDYIKQENLKSQADTIFYGEMGKLIHGVEAFQFQKLSRRTKEVIDGLPTSYRETFLMRRFTKRSYREIAEISGVSIKTIAYRIQQTTKLLRKDLVGLLITTLVCALTTIH